MLEKLCAKCARKFTTNRPYQRFCSAQCSGLHRQAAWRRRNPPAAEPRACWWCQTEFVTHDGRRDYCSAACARVGKSLWSMAARYGITRDRYRDLWVRQDGKCAICRQPERSPRQALLCVDHNHDSGRVRGLLCSHCNRAIGLLGDDPAVLRRAGEYLSPTFGEYVLARRGGMSVQMAPRSDPPSDEREAS